MVLVHFSGSSENGSFWRFYNLVYKVMEFHCFVIIVLKDMEQNEGRNNRNWNHIDIGFVDILLPPNFSSLAFAFAIIFLREWVLPRTVSFSSLLCETLTFPL